MYLTEYERSILCLVWNMQANKKAHNGNSVSYSAHGVVIYNSTEIESREYSKLL